MVMVNGKLSVCKYRRSVIPGSVSDAAQSRGILKSDWTLHQILWEAGSVIPSGRRQTQFSESQWLVLEAEVLPTAQRYLCPH